MSFVPDFRQTGVGRYPRSGLKSGQKVNEMRSTIGPGSKARRGSDMALWSYVDELTAPGYRELPCARLLAVGVIGRADQGGGKGQRLLRNWPESKTLIRPGVAMSNRPRAGVFNVGGGYKKCSSNGVLG